MPRYDIALIVVDMLVLAGPVRQRQRSSLHAEESLTDDDSSETAAEDVSPDASAAARSSLLQQSLAARNRLEPQALHQLHSAFFPSRPDTSIQPATSIPPFRKVPMQQARTNEQPGQQPHAQTAFGLLEHVPGFAHQKPKRGPGLTNWRRPAAAITAPTPPGMLGSPLQAGRMPCACHCASHCC